MTSTSPRFQVMRQIAMSIGGFMDVANVAIWDALLCRQMDGQIQGHLLEIGTYKGRSASILCQHRRPDEKLWIVDFSQFIEEAKVNLAALGAPPEFRRCKSSDLWRMSEFGALRRTFRWIHVDGEHTGHALANDLGFAAEMLNDQGLICVDDFFNAAYPQITAAVFNWLSNHPSELTLVLCGQNKAYLSRPTFAHAYLEFIRTKLIPELRGRGVATLGLFKTAPTPDFAGWGIAPRYGERDLYGLDENPDVLL
jgi:predicted O-methyltransferase YrrM